MSRAATIKTIVGIVLVLVLMFALSRCMSQPARNDAAAAKVDATMSDARASSGKDAVDTISNTSARENGVAQTTKENSDAIHAAPGANVAVDPAVDDAGRRSLCRRAAYRDSKQCKRLLGARP
jgi:hypothetical protein